MPSFRFDLHVHSVHSEDGLMTPEQILARARATGLDGVAVTDHDTIAGAIATKALETGDILVIVGAEIMTDRGEIIGLFLKEEITERSPEGVVREIRAQGGLAVVPHPFDFLRKTAFHIGEDESGLADAIEVFNSRCLFQSCNRRAGEYAKAHNLPGVAGSDAHYADEVGSAGVVVGDKDILSAIKLGRLEVFGTRCSPVVHMRTKARKVLGRLHP